MYGTVDTSLSLRKIIGCGLVVGMVVGAIILAHRFDKDESDGGGVRDGQQSRLDIDTPSASDVER